MKISIEIDASPQEVREFFGWPQIQSLQDDLIRAMQDNVKKQAVGYDPLTLMKSLAPTQMQGIGLIQKAFLDAMIPAASRKDEDTKTEGAARK